MNMLDLLEYCSDNEIPLTRDVKLLADDQLYDLDDTLVGYAELYPGNPSESSYRELQIFASPDTETYKI